MLRQQLLESNKVRINYSELYHECVALIKSQNQLGYTNVKYFLSHDYFKYSKEILEYLSKKLRLDGVVAIPDYDKKFLLIDWS